MTANRAYRFLLPIIPVVVLTAVASGQAPVTFDRILRASQEPQNWLTYSGSVLSQRHSPLTQITPDNVKNLELQWVFQARSLEKYEATSIVVDGVLYTVQAPDDVVALDAATGRVFWTYTYTPATQARPCCGRVNRGVAILGDTLFLATIDARLIALDAKTGRPLWNVAVEGARPEAGYAFTLAPLVVKDKVIIGTAGGEYGIRGFIAAFDARTGKEAWRFYTIPGTGEPGNETWAGDSWKTGGASVWVTGSYDPDSNLTYWGIGNPGPDWNGDNRGGDNLYSNSVVALDADTGKLKWHFQFSPHDEFDFDSTQVPVLADINWQGRPTKVMLWANRNGIFYVLDRTSGDFLMGKPFVEVNWTGRLDEKGRPTRVPGKVPTREGSIITPGNQGCSIYPHG
jgi:alcohol dehydrogenase (cytochrome c)